MKKNVSRLTGAIIFIIAAISFVIDTNGQANHKPSIEELNTIALAGGEGNAGHYSCDPPSINVCKMYYIDGTGWVYIHGEP